MKLRNISHDNLHFFKKVYWTIISSTNSMFQSPSFKFKNKTGTSQGVAISKAQKAQNIFFWKTVLALTYFFRLKSSHCTMKTLKNLMKQNFWHFLSSHFKRKHFKNTLNTYLFFCRPVWMPKRNQSYFHNYERKVKTWQKCQTSEIFDFSTTLRSFEQLL